jgi:hypothetical protein
MIKLLISLTATVLLLCSCTQKEETPVTLQAGQKPYNPRSLFISIDSVTLDSFYRHQIMAVKTEQQMQQLRSVFQLMKYYSRQR